MCGVIHAALRATGFCAHGAVPGINAHPLHQGEVNHQPVVAAPESGPVVAAAPHGSKELVLPRKAHGRDDIGYIRASSDQERPLVDHAVVEPAGLLVVRVAALAEPTAQASLEFVNRDGIQHNSLYHDSKFHLRPIRPAHATPYMQCGLRGMAGTPDVLAQTP